MHQHLPHSRRGLDRVSTSDSQSSPLGRPPQHTAANRTQQKTAESCGSLIIVDRSRSRAHADSSVPFVPNPISESDLRTSPRKRAIRQAATIRTHPKTAESCGSQTMTSRSPNRPRPRNRTKSNLDGQSPNQSATAAPVTDDHHPYPAGNSGIPGFADHHQPAAQAGTR